MLQSSGADRDIFVRSLLDGSKEQVRRTLLRVRKSFLAKLEVSAKAFGRPRKRDPVVGGYGKTPFSMCLRGSRLVAGQPDRDTLRSEPKDLKGLITRRIDGARKVTARGYLTGMSARVVASVDNRCDLRFFEWRLNIRGRAFRNEECKFLFLLLEGSRNETKDNTLAGVVLDTASGEDSNVFL